MAVEPQLVDYIKKAREAGQTDEQTRALLNKNGWTSGEVGDAFTSLDQPKNQPQTQPQAQSFEQPKEVQPQSQPRPEVQPQVETETYEPEQTKSHTALKIFVVFIVLAIIGGAGFFMMTQTDLLKSLTSFYSPAPKIVSPDPVAQNPAVKITDPINAVTLATTKITSVLPDYDITKISVFAFSKAGDKVAYCLPKIADGKISCFLNDQILDNQYNYRPSWAGFSPDGKRLIFAYSDPVTKQAFIFENSKESVKYNGSITGLGFSDNSQGFMFIVNGVDKKSFVVLNGNTNAPHDKIYGIPTISSDAKHLFYGARDGQDLLWVADELK